MRKDIMTVIQIQDSPYSQLTTQALKQSGHRPRYRGIPLGSPIPPEEAPPLMIWDLCGFSQPQISQTARDLQYEHSGLLVIGPVPDGPAKVPAELSGALGWLKNPRSPDELCVAIQIALGSFWRLRELQKQLSRSAKALQDRQQIEEAKRIVMRQIGCTEEYAMKRLQTHSRNHNIKLARLARQVVCGYEGLNEV